MTTEFTSATNAASPLGSASSDGLGPLPETDVWAIGSLDMREDVEAYSAEAMEAERQRCYALGVAAGIAQERNRCRYPECVENEDERCPRWLTGECEGPNVEVRR